MHLSNGPKVSDDTEHLVDLKAQRHPRAQFNNSPLSKVGQATRAYLGVRKLENVLIGQIDQERVDT